MAVRYYLNKRGESGSKPVGVALVALRNNRQVKLLTPLRVRPRDWSKRTQRLKPSAPNATETNAELQRLKMDAERLMLEHTDNRTLRVALKERLGRTQEPEVLGILGEYDGFLKEKEARVSPSTMQVYAALRGHLRGWLKRGDAVDEIGPSFLRDLQTHLVNKGLSNSTVNKLTTRAKGFLRSLEDRGLIGRVPSASTLKTERSAPVYLTAEELRAMMEVDLSGYQPGYHAARDLFLAGAFTGQRFSDLQSMRWADLDLEGGWWNLRVKKTSRTIRVPIVAPLRDMIEEREGWRSPLPQLSNQKTNKYLKEVAALAGLAALVETHSRRGGRLETRSWKKCELISTHAARRTFVTLALANGMPLHELLGFTHDDLRVLRLYAGQDERARKGHLQRIFGGV